MIKLFLEKFKYTQSQHVAYRLAVQMGNSFWPILHSTLLACDDHSHFLSARTPTTPISPFPISLFSSAATAIRGSVTSPSAQANDMCGRGFCSENMKLVRQSQGLLRLCNVPTVLIASLSQVPGAISKWYWSARKWISGTSLNLKLFEHCCIITGSRVDHLDRYTMRWIFFLPCKKLVDYGACIPHQQGTLVSWSANQKHEFINWKQRVGLIICASHWQWKPIPKLNQSLNSDAQKKKKCSWKLFAVQNSHLRIAHSNNLKRKKGPCMLIIDENFPAPKFHPKPDLTTRTWGKTCPAITDIEYHKEKKQGTEKQHPQILKTHSTGHINQTGSSQENSMNFA